MKCSAQATTDKAIVINSEDEEDFRLLTDTERLPGMMAA
jgi:hypothetical protein